MVKKEQPEFDLTIGSFDVAKICELVGLNLLDQLSNILPVESFSLYRDDGLAILSGISGPDTVRVIKNIRNFFETNNLKITVEVTFMPACSKLTFLMSRSTRVTANNGPTRNRTQLQYIHTQSNHLPNIYKQLSR